MKPEDDSAYKRLIDQASSVDKLGERMLQEHLRANDTFMRQIAESFTSIQSQAAMRVAEQMAAINWPKMSELVFPRLSNQVAEMLTQLAKSESFNIAKLSAVSAIASSLAFQERNKELERSIAASFARLNRAESVASLSNAFAKQLTDLAQFNSQFAQTMAQTLKSRFDEFEKRNQEAFEQLETSTDEKFQALETKLAESTWMKVLQVLGFLVTLAGFALAIAGYLDSKEQSKVNTALAVQMLTALQEMASKAEQQINVYYVVERTVKLREIPSNRAKTLAILERDDEVRLIKRKHKWVLVECDSESGLVFGWVNKKYLKRVR